MTKVTVFPALSDPVEGSSLDGISGNDCSFLAAVINLLVPLLVKTVFNNYLPKYSTRDLKLLRSSRNGIIFINPKIRSYSPTVESLNKSRISRSRLYSIPK